ncbi:MAG: phosphate signaling complex protein PhoU [Arenicella sp.]|nr:phosphate signaling complex protein PhoU [Arenicella sp.]
MNEELNIGPHISRQFDAELDEIRSRVLKMGSLVETQLIKTLDALREDDGSGIKGVSKLDRKVNKLEVQIDEECTQILAMRQPAAGDLRMIIATSKSVRDLERAGDEAERVANMVKQALTNEMQRKLYKGLLGLGELVAQLLKSTLDAYARMDIPGALQNMRLDQDIDEEYSRLVIRQVELMKKNPDNVADSLDVLWAARSMERIGDHCINICENIIYLVSGDDVRHAKFKDIEEQYAGGGY